MTDPVTQAFAAIKLVVTTAAQVELLIARLQDHARTLAQAEEDRRRAGDRLFPTPPTDDNR